MPSEREAPQRTRGSWSGIATCAVMVAVFAFMIGEAIHLRGRALLAPLAVGIPALILALAQLVIEVRVLTGALREPHTPATTPPRDPQRQETHRAFVLMAWFGALVLLTFAIGVLAAFPIFVFGFLRWHQKEKLRTSVVISAGFTGVVYGAFDLIMGLSLWTGVLPPML